MTRRRLFMVALLAITAVVLAGGVWLVFPLDRITPENAARIQPEMSLKERNTLLGQQGQYVGEQLPGAPDQDDLLDWASEHLLASPGAVVMRDGRAFRIPTLVPARRADGACRFLTTDSRCAIHPVSPFGCAFFDSHMAGAEADRRSKQGLLAILEAWNHGSLYALVWQALAEAGLVALPPEIAREQLRRSRHE